MFSMCNVLAYIQQTVQICDINPKRAMTLKARQEKHSKAMKVGLEKTPKVAVYAHTQGKATYTNSWHVNIEYTKYIHRVNQLDNTCKQYIQDEIHMQKSK